MAGLRSDRVYRALKRGEVSRAYYLSGAETVLKDELVAAITDAVLQPGERDFNLDVRAAADLDGESLHALVETPPMLAERRVVVVRGIEQWRKNAKVWQVVSRYLENPSPTTVLLLVHGPGHPPDPHIAGATTHVALDGLGPDELRDWVVRRAAHARVALEEDAADHLVNAVGDDLSLLASELDKLAAAAGDAPVSAADVGRLVGVRRGEAAHDWVTAILGRDTGRAADMLDVVLLRAGATAVQLLARLGMALVGTRLARGLLDEGKRGRQLEGVLEGRARQVRAASSLLRVRRVEAQSWAEAAARWTAPELDHAIATAREADRQLKSTTISDARGVLHAMVLSLARPEAA